MINVKDKIYACISSVIDNVSDTYPTNWGSFPAVQYVEEQNKVTEWVDDKESKSYVRYRFDIWDQESTTKASLDIDEAISGKLGFERIQCEDVDDPSHLKHKVMRYEAIIEKMPDGEIYVWHQ